MAPVLDIDEDGAVSVAMLIDFDGPVFRRPLLSSPLVYDPGPIVDAPHFETRDYGLRTVRGRYVDGAVLSPRVEAELRAPKVDAVLIK